MKSKFLLFLLAICGGTLLFWSNSGGAAASGNGNRTGSPGAGNCASCHSGGSFNPATTIDITDAQGNSVTTVMADSVYDITVTVSATSGTPTGYGFQAIIIDASDDESTGTLRTAGTGVQFISISGTNNEVAEHTATSASGSFSFSWQAPTTAGGSSFEIYAYGNAVNGNSGTTGDAATGDNITLDFVAAQPSSLENQLQDEVAVTLFPNPVVNQLNVKMEAELEAAYSLRIFGTNGQEIRNQQVQAFNGENQFQIDVTDLSVGAYRVVLQDEDGRMMTKSFVKF